MKISIPIFRLSRPQIKPRQLPNENAEIAVNCRVDRGDLESFDGFAGVAVTSLRSGLLDTIFLYDDQFWFSWNTWVSAIESPIAQDAYQRVYYTGDGVPKVTANVIATGSIPYPTAAYTLGIQSPATPITVAVTPSGNNPTDFSDDEDRAYTLTYVTGYGEEGPAGAPSAIVTLHDPVGDIVTLTVPVPLTNTENITTKRIYRTVTTGTDTQYFFVAEIPLAQTTFIDNVAGAALGDQLQTTDFVGPPADMQGLVMMANGIAVGFSGNEIVPSEAYLPYAYPFSYRRSLIYDIVALAAISTALVVGTTGKPSLFTGTSPGNLTEIPLELEEPCVSARSMVDMGEFAMYASPRGLVAVSVNSAKLITDGVITRRQWKNYKPETIHAYRYDGMYLGFYGDTNHTGNGIGGFLFDPRNGDFEDLNFYMTAGYHRKINGDLYLLRHAAGTNSLFQWDADPSEPLPYIWRSKQFDGTQIAYTAARVKADRLVDVSFSLYVDGSLVFSRYALSNDIFRLPDNLEGRTWQVEVAGTSPVELIELAQTIGEF